MGGGGTALRRQKKNTKKTLQMQSVSSLFAQGCSSPSQKFVTVTDALTDWTIRKWLESVDLNNQRTRFLIVQGDFWLRRTRFLISYRADQRFLKE